MCSFAPSLICRYPANAYNPLAGGDLADYTALMKTNSMKSTPVAVLLASFGLAASCWADKATMALSSVFPVYYWDYGRSLPVDPGVKLYAQVLGGPAANQLNPVVDPEGKPIVMVVDAGGYFHGGVGIVPGVADKALAYFQIRICSEATGRSFPYLSDVWTQATGSWDSQAVPRQPLTGPELQHSDQLVYRGALGSTAIVSSTGTGPLDQWTARASGTSHSLLGIAYGNHAFVAVGEWGIILTSPDGTAWTTRDSGTTNRLFGIVYGTDAFVAVGDAGTVLTSPVGTLWTRRAWETSPPPLPPLAVTNDTWIPRLGDIAYGNHTFVVGGTWQLKSALGVGGATWPGFSLTSPDGIHWTGHDSADAQRYGLGFLTYGKDQFMTMTRDDTLLSSPDGVTWTLTFSLHWDFPVNGVAYGNGRFVGLMWYPYVSTDGITWMQFDPAIGNTQGIIFGNDSFVTVRDFGQIMSSKDGINWMTHVSPTSQSLYHIAFGNGTFVVVGDAGRIVQSAPVTRDPPVISGRFNRDTFEISLEGTVGQAYVIQAASELSPTNLWQTLGTLALTNRTGIWNDSPAQDRSRRFYRALPRP